MKAWLLFKKPLKNSELEGISAPILHHQPRIVSSPPSSGLPWWVACKNATKDEIQMLSPLRSISKGGEIYFEIPFDRIQKTDTPLTTAIRETISAYKKETFEIPFSKGTFVAGPKPRIVGVLNVTPDSFSDGGEFLDPARAIEKAEEMISSGADWIDVGGESTQPGSDPVSAELEKERVLPVIEALAKKNSLPISIDTTKTEVASAALDAGANMINDVSGLKFDPEMPGLAASRGVPVVVNHVRGIPKTMQTSPSYKDPVAEILEELRERIDRGLRAGIAPNKIIADPGIGFGKRPEDNLEILRRFHEFRSLGVPLFVGVSRKSFLGSVLQGRPPKGRLFGTAAAVACAVLGGAKLLRVHDPAEMKDVAEVAFGIASGIK